MRSCSRRRSREERLASHTSAAISAISGNQAIATRQYHCCRNAGLGSRPTIQSPPSGPTSMATTFLKRPPGSGSVRQAAPSDCRMVFQAASHVRLPSEATAYTAEGSGYSLHVFPFAETDRSFPCSHSQTRSPVVPTSQAPLSGWLSGVRATHLEPSSRQTPSRTRNSEPSAVRASFGRPRSALSQLTPGSSSLQVVHRVPSNWERLPEGSMAHARPPPAAIECSVPGVRKASR